MKKKQLRDSYKLARKKSSGGMERMQDVAEQLKKLESCNCRLRGKNGSGVRRTPGAGAQPRKPKRTKGGNFRRSGKNASETRKMPDASEQLMLRNYESARFRLSVNSGRENKKTLDDSAPQRPNKKPNVRQRSLSVSVRKINAEINVRN